MTRYLPRNQFSRKARSTDCKNGCIKYSSIVRSPVSIKTSAGIPKAITDYSQAIKLDPKDAEAYNSRAWAYFKSGIAITGLSDAKKAVLLKPNDYFAWDTLGAIYEDLGDKTEAIDAYRKAMSFDL